MTKPNDPQDTARDRAARPVLWKTIDTAGFGRFEYRELEGKAERCSIGLERHGQPQHLIVKRLRKSSITRVRKS